MISPMTHIIETFNSLRLRVLVEAVVDDGLLHTFNLNDRTAVQPLLISQSMFLNSLVLNHQRSTPEAPDMQVMDDHEVSEESTRGSSRVANCNDIIVLCSSYPSLAHTVTYLRPPIPSILENPK
jgi:hypothetical protein